MKEKLYLAFDKKSKLTKIGKAIDVNKRMTTFRTANPYIRIIFISDVLKEKDLHKIYKHKRVVGEWFSLCQSDIIEITNDLKFVPKELRVRGISNKLNVEFNKKEVFSDSIKLEYKKVIGFTRQQQKAFKILESYGVNVNKFIRLAVSEKLKKDWKSIKESKQKVKCPF